MAKVHNLGFPRVGSMRELKFAQEGYWSGKSSKEELLKLASEIRKINWDHQKSLDLVAVGDFSLYDQVLDMSFTLGNIPQRARNYSGDVLDNYFTGVVRFKFNDLCDANLGSEDYLNIASVCKHVFIEDIPTFNDDNSNQQLRFITLIDIFYEKKILLTISAAKDLLNLGTSKIHSKVFKRVLSRLQEMTKIL